MAGRGRPKGSKNKPKINRDKYDEGLMLTKVACTLSPQEVYTPKARRYHCSACNQYFDSFSDFVPSNSHFYYANNGRTTICYDCAAHFWKNYSKALGTKVKGFERLCQKLDLYFHLPSYKIMMEKTGTSAKLIKKYVSLLNVQGTKTYDNNLNEESSPDLERVTVLEEKIMEEEKDYIDSLIKDFGTGFSTEELKRMDAHRKELMQQLQGGSEEDDIVIRQAVNSACSLLIFKERAVENNNASEVMKLTKAYTEAITGKGITDYLKKKQATIGVTDCQGVWVKEIEQYCPAEIWKDKSIYADMRKFRRYHTRHFLRSIKNFFTGNYVPDEEYNIGVE